MGKDTGNKMSGLAVGGNVALEQVFAIPVDGNIHMHAAAGLVLHGLGHKAGKQAVAVRNSFDGAFEGVQVIGRFERSGIHKVHFVLAKAAFVVAVLGAQAHILHGKADLAADVLGLVQRGNVKVAAVVHRDAGGVAVLVGLEQIELTFAAHIAAQAHGLGALDHRLQVPAAVAGKGAAIGQGDIAVHAHYTALGGAPGQNGHCVRVWPKHKVALLSVHKPGNGAAVKADTLLEGIGKVPGKDRDVFLIAENITERQTYKFYVVIFDIVQDILCSMLHGGILQCLSYIVGREGRVVRR